MIRTGLFHRITNVGKNNLEALEFENPCEKFDLIRYEDKYGRQKKKYETKEYKSIKKRYNFFTKKNLEYKFDKCILRIKNYTNIKQVIQKHKNSTIHTFLKEDLINEQKKPAIPLGDLIRNGSVKKLLQRFQSKKNVRMLSVIRINKK
jgi:hypothetical protein